jgi:hypothetical protein
MRIIFDQATPVPIRPYLQNHSLRTAAQEGWDKLRNGDLLTAAEAAGFDLLLTTDKNICYQQNLAGRRIAIVVLGRNSGRNFARIFSLLSKRSIRPSRAAIRKWRSLSSSRRKWLWH